MSYYGWILLLSILGPLGLSFDRKVAFYRKWIPVFTATLIVALVFLVWDSWFTHLTVWGFTPKYVGSIRIAGLPLEECLFFVLIPYACMFVYEVVKAYFPSCNFKMIGKVFAWFFIVSGLAFAAIGFPGRWYTLSACSLAALLMIAVLIMRPVWFGKFAVAYMLCLIPFLVVNGLLTGIATDEPVVWYNNVRNLGIRITTIPLEDLYYNLCLFFPIAWIYEKLSARKQY